MRFIELHIDGFGKFGSFDLAFDEGVNIIYGRNEAGKSTLYQFLRVMLFGIDKRPLRAGKQPLFEDYRPWDTPECFGGRLTIEADGTRYRIERNFAENPEEVRLYNETTDAYEEEPRARLSGLLNGLTETAYLGTISIGQLKAATGREMAAELSRLFANLSQTGSFGLSAEAACAYLKEKREACLRQVRPDTVRQYTAVVGRIKRLEEEIDRPENENRIVVVTKEKTETKKELSALEYERTVLKEQREAAERRLEEQGLRDSSSIQQLSDMVHTSLSRRTMLKEKLNAAGGRILAALCILFAFLSAGLAALLLNGHLFPRLAERLRAGSRAAGGSIGAVLAAAADGGSFYGWIFAALCILLLALFTGLMFARKKRAAELAELTGMLCEQLSPELTAFSAKASDNTETSDAEAADTETPGTEVSAAEELSMEALDMGALKAAFDLRMEENRRLIKTIAEKDAALLSLSARLQELQERVLSLSEMLTGQEQVRGRVEQKLMELYALQTQAEELRRLIAENDRRKTEADAIELAAERISELAASVGNSIGLYVNREAGKLLSGITGGAYRGMDAGNGTDIYLTARDRMIPLSSVSAGTMDQVYLALRMAAAGLVTGGKEGALPLILDDSFALYDDDRLRHALSFAAGDWKGQLLIFSCHHREEQALKELGIPYRLLRLPAAPQKRLSARLSGTF